MTNHDDPVDDLVQRLYRHFKYKVPKKDIRADIVKFSAMANLSTTMPTISEQGAVEA